MPKFIYTITTLILLNILGIYLFISQTSPDKFLNKAIFSILVFFLFSLTIPLVLTVIKVFFKSREDLNNYFKTTFKKNLKVSILISMLFFIKILFDLNLTYLLVVLLTLIIFYKAYPKAVKSIKKSKY